MRRGNLKSISAEIATSPRNDMVSGAREVSALSITPLNQNLLHIIYLFN